MSNYNAAPTGNWFARCRLAWLERHAATAGTIRRADLIQTFGISPAQASADIQTYLGIRPSSLRYDTSTKCYRWERGSSMALDAPWRNFPEAPRGEEAQP